MNAIIYSIKESIMFLEWNPDKKRKGFEMLASLRRRERPDKQKKIKMERFQEKANCWPLRRREQRNAGRLRGPFPVLTISISHRCVSRLESSYSAVRKLNAGRLRGPFPVLKRFQ